MQASTSRSMARSRCMARPSLTASRRTSRRWRSKAMPARDAQASQPALMRTPRRLARWRHAVVSADATRDHLRPTAKVRARRWRTSLHQQAMRKSGASSRMRSAEARFRPDASSARVNATICRLRTSSASAPSVAILKKTPSGACGDEMNPNPRSTKRESTKPILLGFWGERDLCGQRRCEVREGAPEGGPASGGACVSKYRIWPDLQ
mmetsp:Transcript_68581/g.189816  ORF Transcript_68581/g.189816 Transcript_68581/m.189816 type:complete len:208 (-) Transcript_68581:1152-1775(-)